jgi:uncharacterized protein (TIGR03435 family)
MVVSTTVKGLLMVGMSRLIRVAAALFVASLFLVALSIAQNAATPLSFEVASIKPAEPITPQSILAGKMHLGMNVDGARVDIGYLSLGELIPIAFKVKAYQVAGPDWLRSQRFDILAKMPEGATKDDVPQMLQGLLAERFQLKVHRENREANVYALVEVKGGHKMKEALPDTDTPPPPGALTLGRGENQISVSPAAGGRGATMVTGQTGTTKVTPGPDGTMHMDMGKVAMPVFAEMLTPFLDRPVVDMTGLKGNYQVALDLSMETMLSVARASGIGIPIPAAGARGGGDAGLPAGAADPSGGSIFNSVQQLGLRLEPRKAPAEFIVIDHVEKMPTEN